MNAPVRAGQIALNYQGRRYAGSYEISGGVLTVHSDLGDAASPLQDPELGTASAARTLLRQIVTRAHHYDAGGIPSD